VVETLVLNEDEAKLVASRLRYRYEGGTIIAVVQDFESNNVLMVAHMNEEALIKTLTTGYLHLWSLSRRRLWLKGESSGNYQLVMDLIVDCDCDSVVVKVRSLGPTCHTGSRSCFFRKVSDLIKSA